MNEIDEEVRYLTYKRLKLGDGMSPRAIVAYFGPNDAARFDLRLQAERAAETLFQEPQ